MNRTRRFAAGFLCFCSLFLCGSFASAPAKPEAVADKKVYGEYPLAYREIITRFLETRLLDAQSAKIEWLTQPTPGELAPPKGGRQPLIGYLVDFKVNSRNRFGMYTGFQKHRVLIRNGEILHVARL